MKRFLKIFTLLVICLFVLVSGLDATLDRLSRGGTESSFTYYGAKGDVLASYSGDVLVSKAFVKPVPVIAPNELHRT